MKTNKHLLLISIFLGSFMLADLSAQVPNTMYYMPGVPQSNRMNPATQPMSGFYLGLPAAAPLRLQFSSSALGYSDVLIYNESIDSLITPFHPLADKDAFLENLSDVNFFQTNVATSLASLGFRAGQNFLSFDITLRGETAIYYPKGLFEAVSVGFPDGATTSLGGFGTDVTFFTEYSMGWSRSDFLIPNLDIGVRGKILFGLANIATQSSVLDITSAADEWNINADVQINGSVPSFVTINEDLTSDSPIEIDPNFPNGYAVGELIGEAINFGKLGLALDVGVHYSPIDQLTLSASLLDFGSIGWNEGVEGSYAFNYDFVGLEVDPFGDGIDTTFLTTLTDSLMNSFSFTTGDPYRSNLNPKLFVGATFYPIEKIGFGILSRTEFLNQRINQQFTGTVNMTTGKFINLTASYSYMNNALNNIGAGFSFNVGPLNWYMISDNAISAALNPTSTRSVNLWFGMNLTFGWKKAKKKAKQMDKPLVEG